MTSKQKHDNSQNIFLTIDCRSIVEILTDDETGTWDDKLRLFLIYFLLSPRY